MVSYNPGDVIHCQVTKSDPKQEAGLRLEEKHGRIYIRKLEGLFLRRKLPVQVGDELLQLQEKDVKEYQDLNDLKRRIKLDSQIKITVVRCDPDDMSNSTRTSQDGEDEGKEEARLKREPVEIPPDMLLEFSNIRAGCFLQLQGLQARPELNGEVVKVLKEDVDKPGRWQVQVQDATGEIVSVAQDKLTPLDHEVEDDCHISGAILGAIEPGMTMKLFKLKKKAKMNGSQVEVVRPAGKPGRWEVKVLDTQQILSIADVNLKPM